VCKCAVIQAKILDSPHQAKIRDTFIIAAIQLKLDQKRIYLAFINTRDWIYVPAKVNLRGHTLV